RQQVAPVGDVVADREQTGGVVRPGLRAAETDQWANGIGAGPAVDRDAAGAERQRVGAAAALNEDGPGAAEDQARGRLSGVEAHGLRGVNRGDVEVGNVRCTRFGGGIERRVTRARRGGPWPGSVPSRAGPVPEEV